jgi:hypothetical protein
MPEMSGIKISVRTSASKLRRGDEAANRKKQADQRKGGHPQK